MFDIEELAEHFFKSITIRNKGDYSIVTPLFFHIDSDESIALKYSQTEDGRPVISDCGTTRDYLEIKDIDLNLYQEKLKAVKERFFIEEDDGVFIMTMPTDSLTSVKKHLGYFIQGLSLIANIDL